MATCDLMEKIRYTKKIALLFDGKANCIDPYALPSNQWTNDPVKWPAIEFGQIYMYLIESPGMFTKEKLKAYKSLDAYNYCIRYVPLYYTFE